MNHRVFVCVSPQCVQSNCRCTVNVVHVCGASHTYVSPQTIPSRVHVLLRHRSLYSALVATKPLAFLDFHLPPGAYDINVTPDKRKVFVQHETAIMTAFAQVCCRCSKLQKQAKNSCAENLMCIRAGACHGACLKDLMTVSCCSVVAILQHIGWPASMRWLLQMSLHATYHNVQAGLLTTPHTWHKHTT